MTSQTTNTPVEVDIVSDIVCPWCWLGVRYFQQAAKQVDIPIVLNWHPYMLDPNVPKQGVPYKKYMADKFGDTPNNKFKSMRSHLEEAGPSVGIEFKFTGIPMRPNTLNAHRIMKWAGGQNKSSDMAEALFYAFFTEQKDIGNVAVLSNIAADVGLDSALVRELLTTDKDKKSVENEIAHFAQLGISAVPTFIYNRQYIVQGAQPVETHMAAIKKLAETSAKALGA